jgi:hypothetical protein
MSKEYGIKLPGFDFTLDGVLLTNWNNGMVE